jgi:enoyl-CoA hydratase/carnithine racemase
MTVTVERRERATGGAVAWVTMQREHRLNALDDSQIAGLVAAFDGCASDPDLRAVVLTGSGRAFIGGADIDEMSDLDATGGRRFIASLHRACAAVRACPVPVIAAINGYCLGGGLEVAAACDLRIAVGSARFAMPEVRLGLPSVIEAALLPRLVGWGKAAELVLTAAEIDAAEAHRIGLVQKVAADDGLDAGVEHWLAELCAAGPVALKAQKALLRRWEREPLDRAVAAGIESFAQVCGSGEPARKIAEFKAARAAAKAKR